MPNRKNIESPISLVGLGRSGTSLVMDLFSRHPKVQSLGETTNFIYSSYYHFLESLPYCGPREGNASNEMAAADAVRAALVKTFPSRKRFWFHKPLRLPVVAKKFGKDFPDFIEWYWRASRVLFPGGRFFTVLRDPEAAAVSAMKRWNYSEGMAMRMLERNYQMLLGQQSRVNCIVRFEDLVENREASVRRLFDYCGLRFERSFLKSFDLAHAQNLTDEPPAILSPIPEAVTDLYRELLGRAENIR